MEQRASALRAGIYLASPLGFTPYTARYAREVEELVRSHGLIPLDPWSAPEGAALGAAIAAGAPLKEIAEHNRRVGAANLALIEESRAVLACCDGIAVDDGTASEIGYAAGIGRLVVGYRTDVRTSGDNIAAPLNLQILHLIEMSGGLLTTTVEHAIEELIARL